jgi:hypothetical protein
VFEIFVIASGSPRQLENQVVGETYKAFPFQGTVESTGSFAELQESGLDFARQLNLDVEEEDKELKKGSMDHDKSHASHRNMMRQNSETSQVVFNY